MHSKPTHPILYHAPEETYPKLKEMAKGMGKSMTAIITIAVNLLYDLLQQESEKERSENA